jgi:hypothetical protein
LQSALNDLVKVASAAAKGTRVPPDFQKRIADYTNDLLKVIRGSPEAGPNTRKLAYLLRAAFWIGKEAYRLGPLVQQKRERAASATAAKRKASEKRREIIMHHADAILKKHPTYTSHRIGPEIADAVNRELPTVGLAPLTPNAISKIVRKQRTNERSSG